jgi:hypothetical protein
VKSKIFSIALVLALMATMFLGSVVLADDPTEVSVTWDGSGGVGVDVNTGDAFAGVVTSGSHIGGSFITTDFNNNPYGYGVDSFDACLNASVINGYINTGNLRTDSFEGMYGNAGQNSWSSVSVDGGSASMAYHTTSNYAIIVDATYYNIDRGILDGGDNSGVLNAWGSGSATLDCMSSEASGVWDLVFGRGAGCYTDANYTATGSGHFDVTGTGNTSVVFNGLGISSGGGSLSIIADFVNSFSINDYSLTAK